MYDLCCHENECLDKEEDVCWSCANNYALASTDRKYHFYVCRIEKD